MSRPSMKTSSVEYTMPKVQFNVHNTLCFEWFRAGVSNYGKPGVVFFLKVGRTVATITIHRPVKELK